MTDLELPPRVEAVRRARAQMEAWWPMTVSVQRAGRVGASPADHLVWATMRVHDMPIPGPWDRLRDVLVGYGLDAE